MVVSYFIIRVALGLNIFLHGAVRFRQGRHAFAEALCREFSDTSLPQPWVRQIGMMLPVVEWLLGILLLLGLFTNLAIVAGSLVMLLLLAGKSIRQDWQTVGFQMIYIAYYAVLGFLQPYNSLALDSFFWNQ